MTIILRDNGIDRTYKCENQWAAIVLFAALIRQHRQVEMWDGATLVQKYDSKFTI